MIVGYTAPAGSRQHFGALLLGAYKMREPFGVVTVASPLRLLPRFGECPLHADLRRGSTSATVSSPSGPCGITA